MYPRAEKWAKEAVSALDRSFFMGEYRVKHWVVDFIESFDGLTYLSQIKSFKSEKIKKLNNIKRKLMKSQGKSAQNTLNWLFLKGLGVKKQQGHQECQCMVFCSAIPEKVSKSVLDLFKEISLIPYFNTRLLDWNIIERYKVEFRKL